MYIDKKLLQQRYDKIIEIQEKFPHHTEEEKGELRRARMYVETYEALVVLLEEIKRCEMEEHQELKKVMRQP